MRASIVITTKNRKEELRAAIASALRQSGQPEVIVMDDGSTDGTAVMVRAEFPSVRLERSAESLGYIVQRNRAARLASGKIIFSLDDDAEFSTPLVVEQTLRDFDAARIGAVAVPYLEPNKANRLMQSPPDNKDTWITDTFIGTAHALRRDLFLALGGYREPLVHQGEESDFCIRMLDAGWLVRLGTADPIHHHESPKRDHRRMDFYGARNAILYVWQNVPWPAFPVHLLATTVNILRWTFEPHRFVRRLGAVLVGYAWCLSHWDERKPVGRACYQRSRRLCMNGALPLCQIET